MSEHERLKWIRLDNAAKVFPPTVKKTDTRVFRFNCRLFEDIQPELLQSALDKVVAEFPHFLYVIRQGLFWYYFEQSKLKPVVTPGKRVSVRSALYPRKQDAAVQRDLFKSG